MGLVDDLAADALRATVAHDAAVSAENARATAAAPVTGFGKDDRYWRSLAFSFRLILNVGPSQSVQNFPLVINPERYEKSHPFALSVSPAQEGGVFVERQGIVISTITLEGTTGFAPRANPDETGVPTATLPLSGHAHFKRLQDLCFREHSDRMKDHSLAPNALMTFHNFADDEHWIVEPEEFTLKRTKDDRVLYRYMIRLKVLGEVRDLPRPLSEDQPVIDKLADQATALEEAAAAAAAALKDLEGVDGEISESVVDVAGFRTSVVDNIGKLNTELSRVIGATNEYIRGIKRTIAIPFAAVTTARDRVFQVTDLLRRAGTIPLDVIQVYQNIEDSLDAIATYPDLFVAPFDVVAEEFLALTQGPATATSESLSSASNSAVTQLDAFRSSALRPGDLTRVNGGIFQQRRIFPRYEGFREVLLIFQDTLQKVAARELGDARRWVDIAITNGLTAPYISEEGLPGTKRPGDKINIPIEKRGGPQSSIRSAGDSDLRASQLEVILGRDMLLSFGADGKATLVVDDALGSTDFKTVAGEANLSQAVIFILSVERGQDVLYQQLGYEKIVGRRGTYERLINGQLSIVEAVNQDPRIVKTSGVSFTTTPAGDGLSVELDAVVIDNTQLRVIGRVLS